MSTKKEERRKCPCSKGATCEAYQRLYPIDPLCVRGKKKEDTTFIDKYLNDYSDIVDFNEQNNPEWEKK